MPNSFSLQPGFVLTNHCQVFWHFLPSFLVPNIDIAPSPLFFFCLLETYLELTCTSDSGADSVKRIASNSRLMFYSSICRPSCARCRFMTHTVVSQPHACQDTSTFLADKPLGDCNCILSTCYKHLKPLFPLLALCQSLAASFLHCSAFASVSKCFISSPPSPHCPFSRCLRRSFIIYFTTPSLLHRCVPRAVDVEPGCECASRALPVQ